MRGSAASCSNEREFPPRTLPLQTPGSPVAGSIEIVRCFRPTEEEPMASSSADTPKRDLYQQITDQIVAAIEAGAGSAEMPWHRSGVATTRPTNAFSGQAYRGVNIVSLWAATATRYFSSGHWATFKQWRCLGAQVRKGEKGSPIVFYKRYVAGQSDVRAGERRRHQPRWPCQSSALARAHLLGVQRRTGGGVVATQTRGSISSRGRFTR